MVNSIVFFESDHFIRVTLIQKATYQVGMRPIASGLAPFSRTSLQACHQNFTETFWWIISPQNVKHGQSNMITLCRYIVASVNSIS